MITNEENKDLRLEKRQMPLRKKFVGKSGYLIESNNGNF